MEGETVYAWTEDGALKTGSLVGYALTWEHGHYSGDVSLSSDVLTWDGVGEPVRHPVEVTRVSGEDDYIDYYFKTPLGDRTAVRIDGRA